MSKGKGQQPMEHNSLSLEFQLPDGKDNPPPKKKKPKTAQKCYLVKI